MREHHDSGPRTGKLRSRCMSAMSVFPGLRPELGLHRAKGSKGSQGLHKLVGIKQRDSKEIPENSNQDFQ